MQLTRDIRHHGNLAAANVPTAQDQAAGYPAIVRDNMKYGTIASSHLNMLLRCYGQGATSPITSTKFVVGGVYLFVTFRVLGIGLVADLLAHVGYVARRSDMLVDLNFHVAGTAYLIQFWKVEVQRGWRSYNFFVTHVTLMCFRCLHVDRM
jgi:hypothetical protein